jgi:hypothetical protein
VSGIVQVPVEPQRRPIVIRSLIPRTEDEMLEARNRILVASCGWPVIVLDSSWEAVQ